MMFTHPKYIQPYLICKYNLLNYFAKPLGVTDHLAGVNVWRCFYKCANPYLHINPSYILVSILWL
ncbi:hypothetical protein D3C72_1333320 [compost metagenome]